MRYRKRRWLLSYSFEIKEKEVKILRKNKI